MPGIKKVFTAFAILLLLSGCSQKAIDGARADGISLPDNESREPERIDAVSENGGGSMAGAKAVEKVAFRTEDGFMIKGNFTKGGRRAVVLLPQFTSNRDTYAGLAAKLADANFTVLALDLRGHGQSLDRNGLKAGYGEFSEQDFRNMTIDVKAAKVFLGREGFSLFAIVGSSIGANTALNYASADMSVERIVLLSPGMNFKGIETEKPSRSVKAKTLIVASDDDAYSFGSGKALAQNIPGAEFMALSGAGHGTNMFNGTFLERDIAAWLVK